MCSSQNKTKPQLCIHNKWRNFRSCWRIFFIGITICDNLKPSTHVKYITTKANQSIGLIKRCFESRSEKVIKTLYETMIRPVLEYASPAWNPFYRKYIDELEKVQKRALNLSIAPVESVPLEQRLLEADLCKVYKYLSDLNRNNPDHLFSTNVAAI